MGCEQDVTEFFLSPNVDRFLTEIISLKPITIILSARKAQKKGKTTVQFLLPGESLIAHPNARVKILDSATNTTLTESAPISSFLAHTTYIKNWYREEWSMTRNMTNTTNLEMTRIQQLIHDMNIEESNTNTLVLAVLSCCLFYLAQCITVTESCIRQTSQFTLN